jgi:hypothetical protein
MLRIPPADSCGFGLKELEAAFSSLLLGAWPEGEEDEVASPVGVWVAPAVVWGEVVPWGVVFEEPPQAARVSARAPPRSMIFRFTGIAE